MEYKLRFRSKGNNKYVSIGAALNEISDRQLRKLGLI